MDVDLRSRSLLDLAAAYRDRSLRPTDVVRAFLEVVEEGPVYRVVTAERALAQARRAERAFDAGIDLGPMQGIPFAIKDLLDMEGEVSAAGSAGLEREGRVASCDAPLLARLDAVGAVFLGKTHMTELAFSGLGLNPHFGTPGCVLDEGRVPGGSSSGSAVAVARGWATAGIGSDTGGSVRIPAAFQGLVGLKTSNGVLPNDGVVALSTTLDTIGPITRTVEDAWAAWRALAALPHDEPPVVQGPLRLWAPPTVLCEDLDDEVHAAFGASLDALEAAGHDVVRVEEPVLGDLAQLYGRYGSFAAHEALAAYEDFVMRADPPVDRRVAVRILQARERPSSDYLRLHRARTRLAATFWERAAAFDAVLSPTVAVRAPHLHAVADDDAYMTSNATVLRNTTLFNLLGGPVVTIPIGGSALGIGGSVATPPGTEGQAIAVAARWQQS